MSEEQNQEPVAEQPLVDSDKIIKLSSIASAVHEEWLTSADRSYSPFNKPWAELSAEAQAHIGRQAFLTLQLVAERNPTVWEDDIGSENATNLTVPELAEAADEAEVVE